MLGPSTSIITIIVLIKKIHINESCENSRFLMRLTTSIVTITMPANITGISAIYTVPYAIVWSKALYGRESPPRNILGRNLMLSITFFILISDAL